MDQVDAEKVRSLLGDEDLAWLIERLRKKMAKGEPLTGKVQLATANAGQRTAIAKLMGRPPRPGQSITVDLEGLTSLLTHAHVCTRLEDAVEAIVGPIHNQRAASELLEREWMSVWNHGRKVAAENNLVLNWLEDLCSSGLLKRFAGGDPKRARRLMDQALDVLLRAPHSAVRLAELAASVTGDSHALDRSQPLGSLVVRFAAQLDETASWKTTEQRRDAWETLGVLCDELSAPVLVLNLRGDDQSLTGRALNFHAEAHEPFRVSVRMLRRYTPAFSIDATGRDIYVCENPTVVDVAANRLRNYCKPLVCIDGQPKTASRLLLNLLVDAGCTIRYHGDFDWDGIRIANKIMQRHGAVSWRFCANDYSNAKHSNYSLQGKSSIAEWDSKLTELMRQTGVCIHEEQVLDDLMSDLDVRS